MFIEPSSGFIDWLNCEYRNLAEKRGVNTTVDEAISDAIAEIKLTSNGKPLSPRGLINRLVGSLLAKYSPAFDWSSTATAHFEKRAHQSKSPFYSLWFMTWSYLAWAVNIISAPGRWCINKIIHKAVKIFVVWKIDSKLNAKDGSLDFGKLALSSVYKTLSAKLKIINRSDRSKEAEGTRKKLALEQTAFVDLKVQNDIGKLVFSFITLLYTRDTDLFHLQSRFAPGNIFEGPKFALMKIALSSGIQKATEQIIQGLQIFLEEKSFSVGILNVLENIREQSLDFNTNNASKSVGHHETYDQLRDTVRHGIQEIINDKLDPSKAMQDEADLFIDGLKSDIKKFNSQISAISDLTLSNLEELHELGTVFLVDVFRRRCERAEAKTNADARGHITTTKRKFSELGTPLYSRIEKLVKLAQNRKNFENLIKDLSDLQAPLEKATINEALPNQTNPSATKFYKELQLTLQIVRNKTYPEPVRLLITRLQGHFDTWKTETAKIDNQTILNGTISRLKSAIRQEIENNEDNIERATREIAEEFQQTRQLIASLNDWAKRLTHFKCVMEEQDIGALQQVLSRLAEDRASPLIFEHLNGFFLALGMNYNIKGILWYCIKAYLELPVKSPKEIKKILDKVKTKLQEPVSNSDFPT
jgi:hypothetical protein